jgi:lipoprotein-anchoring transpeptidase ErfK/SrfK
VTVPNIEVFTEPHGDTVDQTFENPWHVNNDPALGVPLVFLVEDQRDDWVEVLLPVRPNGSTGWVRTDDVRIAPVPYRIEVRLGEHTLTVYDRDEVLLEETVAVGAADTPTPVGKYFLRVLIKAPDPTTVYGPFAYGLSGHSDALQEFNGGDAELGIHGNDDASVLGQSITHGCVRMSNAGITRLTSILPLGTPVEIET